MATCLPYKNSIPDETAGVQLGLMTFVWWLYLMHACMALLLVYGKFKEAEGCLDSVLMTGQIVNCLFEVGNTTQTLQEVT